MPSLLKMFKPCSGTCYKSDDENNASKYAQRGKYAQSRARTRKVKSTVHPAACRGLYAVPTKQRRMKSYSTQVEQLNCAREDDDPNDPIFKHSVYPQMNGKRRSELEAALCTRTAKYDRPSTREDCREHTARGVRPRSMESDSSSDFDPYYSSDGNPEGRPVRVCIYPPAKYIKEPAKTPFNPQRVLEGYESSSTVEPATPRTPSYRNWKRSSLPQDEYYILRRRHVMQRAREALEPHYAQRGSALKKGLVGHGETQCFTGYHTERRRISRMQYAVRKAMQADLDPFSDDFYSAMTRHADKVCFCELSDVDGVPIDEKLMWDFIRTYRKARDEAYEPNDSKEAMVRPRELLQRTSIEERNDHMQQATRHRADSEATTRTSVQRPVLISRFSWDNSDSEVETSTRKRFTKTKR